MREDIDKPTSKVNELWKLKGNIPSFRKFQNEISWQKNSLKIDQQGHFFIQKNFNSFSYISFAGTYKFCEIKTGKIVGAYFGDKREVKHFVNYRPFH